MKVSDYIVNFLVSKHISHVFTVVGAGNVHLLNSIERHKDISYVCTHHEQAGVMAALAYKRISNRLGVMITTQGGGASNAITGVLDAWADSIPCLVISGQEKTQFLKEHDALRMYGVQGFNVVKTVAHMTKYATVVDDPKMIRFHLEKAVHLAESGRPGPVWLDIPIDVQSAHMDERQLVGYEPDEPVSTVGVLDVAYVIEALKKSKRPVFIFGNGIRLANAASLVFQVTERISIPFLTSWNGMDILPTKHLMYFGHEGTYGQRCANFVVQNADLVVAIGTRLAIPQVGYDVREFAREAEKIVVDIDPTELSKFQGVAGFKTIVADAKQFLGAMLEVLNQDAIQAPAPWVETCTQWRERYPVYDPTIHHEKDGNINSYHFIHDLAAHFNDDEIVVTDMGTALTCTHQVIAIQGSQRIVTSTGLGEMGYGIPGAIGASLAAQKQRVTLINGDGSMMMNLQELQTVTHHNLPIKIFIYVNDGYLTIKHTQKNIFGEFYSGSGEKSGVSCPDFGKIGKAFGFEVFEIKRADDIASVVSKVYATDGPVICTVDIDPIQPLLPKLSFALNPDGTMISPPLEDLSPFLPRQVLREEMIIGVHEKSTKIAD